MSGSWNTIESDAGVFTFLVENLGVKGVELEELVSLDEDSLSHLNKLLTFCTRAASGPVQSPVYGVIFLFKYPSANEQRQQRQRQGGLDDGGLAEGTYDFEAAENIFFAAQTIQNACGTQALLSVLLNKDDEIEIGPQLKEFKEFTGAFPADLRGEALSNAELIRTVHNSFARSSPFIDETARLANPEDEDAEAVYHFIAYASINDTLYELDGLQPAPISHGPCPASSFAAAVVPVLQRRIARYPDAEIRFNLMAMVKDGRERAREAGDMQALQRQEEKREEWEWENALRRHNFVGFIGELLKMMVKDKVEKGNGEYERWIEEARAKGAEKMGRGKKAAGAEGSGSGNGKQS